MLLNKLTRLKNVFVSKEQNMVDLTGCVLPVDLVNTDRNYEVGDDAFLTRDFVYLETVDDIKSVPQNERTVMPTAYAIANGTAVYDNGTSSYWLRTAYSNHSAEFVSGDGVTYDKYVNDAKMGIVPSMRLDLQAIMFAQESFTNVGKINASKQTIEFGFYPKVMVSDADKFEELLKQKQLVPTGKRYLGGLKENGKFAENLEYKYRGEFYVRVKNCGGSSSMLNTLWYRVSPIVWKIKNWQAMPKSINPQGNGTAEYLEIKTEQAVMGGIPFYPKLFDDNNSFWQNSTIRGYLNGINVGEIKNNGNLKYLATNGGDFFRRGFLQESLTISSELVGLQEQEQVKTKPLVTQKIIKQSTSVGLSL